jgi:hypothetical protein
MDTKEAMKKIEDAFGSRMGFLGFQITMLSMTGQPCDVTFYKKKPAIDVKIDQKINIARVGRNSKRAKRGQVLQ